MEQHHVSSQVKRYVHQAFMTLTEFSSSTHEEARTKRASSPLLVEPLPSPSPPSTKLQASKSNATIRPTVAHRNVETGPSTTTPLPSRTAPAPSSAKPDQKEPEISHKPKQEMPVPVPRLLPPQNRQGPVSPTSKFSMEIEMASRGLRRTATNLKLKLDRSMSGLRSSRSNSAKKGTETEVQAQSNPRFSPPQQIAVSSSPQKQDSL